MRYLLDVNALLALGLAEHSLHQKTAAWVHAHRTHEFLTCSITELGFVRVATQGVVYGYSVADARELLRRMRSVPVPRFQFVSDGDSADVLPTWVVKSGQVTDGHLLELAANHGAKLATLDTGIPGAYRISSATD